MGKAKSVFILLIPIILAISGCNFSSLTEESNSCKENDIDSLFVNFSQILGTTDWNIWTPRCEPRTELSQRTRSVQSQWVFGASSTVGVSNIGPLQRTIFYDSQSEAQNAYPDVEERVFEVLLSPDPYLRELTINPSAEQSHIACHRNDHRFNCYAVMLHDKRITYLGVVLEWQGLEYISEEEFIEIVMDADQRASSYQSE